jgi:CHAT domain-containing protein
MMQHISPHRQPSTVRAGGVALAIALMLGQPALATPPVEPVPRPDPTGVVPLTDTPDPMGPPPLPTPNAPAHSPAHSPAGQAPSATINPANLQQALDREDMADAIRQIEQGWTTQYEAYFQRAMTKPTRSLPEIASTLTQLHRQTGQKAALIYAVPMANQLELILVLPSGQTVHRRVPEASRAQLLATVTAFQNGVGNPDTLPGDYLPAAQQLYTWVMAPLDPSLQANGIDTLILCVGGGLRSTPLAALHDGQQFLVAKYGLAMIPAFSLMDTRVQRLRSAQVLAMGASEFQQLSPLPAVPFELAAIQGDRWRGQTLLNPTFTVANLKQQRQRYPFEIIHLATHAAFLPGDMNQSFIQFWDAPLKLGDLRALNLTMPAVQLLVLSACQTALGDAKAELGFAGLALQSGAQTAIASLWSVSDAGTLVLMSEFYQQLRTAPTRALALRRTQLALASAQVTSQDNRILRDRNSQSLPPVLANLQSQDLAHPYYWAAFTLIGNPW